jgi:hypothetical protein
MSAVTLLRHRRTSAGLKPSGIWRLSRFLSMLAAGLALAVMPLPASAATNLPRPFTPWATYGDVNLYVAPNGSDTNPGSSGRPFRQIQRAAEAARPGTVVHIASGSYDPVINVRSGTPGKPVTFLANQRGGVRIHQTGIDPAWLNYANHVDIVGFDVSAPRSHTGVKNLGSYVRVFNSHVHDVFTQGYCTAGAGINHELYTATGNAAIGNTVHQIGVIGCSLTHGIYVSNANARVQDNVVYDVSGWLLHFYHAANAGTVTSNTVFAGDTSRGAQTDGAITLCADEGHTAPADDFVVSNNVIRDTVIGIAECGTRGVNIGANNRYENNVMYNVGIPLSLRR